MHRREYKYTTDKQKEDQNFVDTPNSYVKGFARSENPYFASDMIATALNSCCKGNF